MAVSADYLAYVLDQLGRVEGVSSRRMFGGAGLYSHECFFGLIAADTLYLRVDDANRARYVTRGMGRFRPYADRPELSMNYYEVPAEVLEDGAELALWAAESIAAARTASGHKPARRALRAVRSRPAPQRR
ncbi:MAG: TfoX/Sxy family protein [Proteobacteria bacterium]|nr:TfoX/Sxy family protein [Pseudomonadota bacterium]